MANQVTVNQNTTRVVTIKTSGPRGPQGLPGPSGSAGPSGGDISDLNNFSGSIQTQVNNLEAITGSLITFTGSADTRIQNLEQATGSFIQTSQTSSMAVGSATDADNLYVNFSATDSIYRIPMISGVGSDHYPFKSPANEVNYYYRTTNPVNNVSQQADCITIGGGANTAGGVFLNSTAGIPSFVYSDGPLHLFSTAYKVEISSSDHVSIVGETKITGSLAITSVANAGSDTDKFLVLDGDGNVDFRTGAEVRSDIGAGTGAGDITSVSGSGNVSGITLSGDTTTGDACLTLGGTFTTTTSSISNFNSGVGTLVNGCGFTSCTGTVTSVEGTGTVSGLTLSGTVTSTGNLTLGGTFTTTTSSISDFNTGVGTIIDGCGFGSGGGGDYSPYVTGSSEASILPRSGSHCTLVGACTTIAGGSRATGSGI